MRKGLILAGIALATILAAPTDVLAGDHDTRVSADRSRGRHADVATQDRHRACETASRHDTRHATGHTTHEARGHRVVVATHRPARRPHRHVHGRSCEFVRGHYEVVKDREFVPGHFKVERVGERWERRYSPSGRSYIRVKVDPGHIRRTWIPAHHRVVRREVWVDGYSTCTRGHH